MKVFLSIAFLVLVAVPVAADMECGAGETPTDCAARLAMDLAVDFAKEGGAAILDLIEGPCADARFRKTCITAEAVKLKKQIKDITSSAEEFLDAFQQCLSNSTMLMLF